MPFEFFFESPDGRSTVVIEDDGQTAWAYLRDAEGTILSDVWLYNVAPSPSQPEPPERGRPPLNPAAWCLPEMTVLIASEEDVAVRWHHADEPPLAEILVADEILARLEAGAKPGWSRFAAADGPCARRLGGA